MSMEEASVRRMILVTSLFIGLAVPVRLQASESLCFQRFEACAIACALLGMQAKDGCLGACLRDNGCAIDERQMSSRSMPDSTLPDGTLPGGTLPTSRMPAGSLPDSQLP